jgi:hypothetical protein
MSKRGVFNSYNAYNAEVIITCGVCKNKCSLNKAKDIAVKKNSNELKCTHCLAVVGRMGSKSC